MPTSFDELHVGRLVVAGVEVVPGAPAELLDVLPEAGIYIPDSQATTIKELREDFNDLLAKLRRQQEGGPCLPAFPDSEALTIRGLRDDYNALLALLRYVGMMEVGDVH